MLDAETEFLPVNQDLGLSPIRPYEAGSPVRPSTAPSKTSPTSKDFPHRVIYGDVQQAWPASDHVERQRSPGMPVQRGVAVPRSPKSSPRAGSAPVTEAAQYKTGTSPVMRALDFRPPTTTALTTDEESDGKSSTAVDLRIIKSILASKNKKPGVSKPHKPLEASRSVPTPTTAQTSPTAAVKAYTPDNYRTPTRRSLLSQQIDTDASPPLTLPTDKG